MIRKRGARTTHLEQKSSVVETLNKGMSVPNCPDHDKRCVLRKVTKMGKTYGRKYFMCPLGLDGAVTGKRCGFFRFASMTTKLEDTEDSSAAADTRIESGKSEVVESEESDDDESDDDSHESDDDKSDDDESDDDDEPKEAVKDATPKKAEEDEKPKEAADDDSDAKASLGSSNLTAEQEEGDIGAALMAMIAQSGLSAEDIVQATTSKSKKKRKKKPSLKKSKVRKSKKSKTKKEDDSSAASVGTEAAGGDQGKKKKKRF